MSGTLLGISVHLYPVYELNTTGISIYLYSMSGTLLGISVHLYPVYELKTTGISIYVYLL